MHLYEVIRSPLFKTNLASKISAIYNQARQYWLDILLVVVLGVVAGLLSYYGAQLINPFILTDQSEDIWFGSDIGRVFSNMISRGGSHHRTEVHPIFSLIAHPPVYLLDLIGIEPVTAVSIVIAFVASLWLGAIFLLLRLIGCRRFDAVLFSLLTAASASAVFWFVIPETFSFGSLSMLLALCFAVIAPYQKLPSLWYTVVSALTLSITTTNWMAGILVTFVNNSWKKALQITTNAFCLVVLLWGVQKYLFPSARFFIGGREEINYILPSTSGGPLHILKSFIAHTMVMPTINIDKITSHDWSVMFTQTSSPGSASIWGAAAVVLWTALLGLGIWSFFSIKQHLKLRLVLGLTLLGQLALHLIYGEETFLYGLHFIILFIPLVAFSTLTHARLLALLLAGTVTVCTGINNTMQFSKAIKYVESVAPARYQVLGQMQLRPTDPWPRGQGHVVLALPGSREADKAYYEPGGSFSPSVGSFGVSIWLNDAQGNLKATSDNIPLSEINQELEWVEGRKIPGILTKTNYYQTLWLSTQPGRWTLDLKTQSASNMKPVIVIRSVGPAGNPIRSLDWNGQRLLINNRWSLTLNSAPAQVYLGEEGKQGWMSDRSPIAHWESNSGWGYARLELTNGSDWNLVIQDSTPSVPVVKPTVTNTQAALKLDLPEQKFADSLNAQVAHIMMGLVRTETRPGEPTSYPLTWQRHGAYEIASLAHAGQLDVAKELSKYLAENDFFGGFGPEADAPGLAIWALEEVAVRLNQADYDKWLWPHVLRKAEFILKMLETTQPIYQSLNGQIVPKLEKDPDLTLVAEPSQDGLIVGRMDNQRPLLYVNAVSYKGLLDAASLADRLQQPAAAKRWRNAAAKLQQAWEKAFKPPESENDRTYISSLWPTGIAASYKDEFVKGLETRWNKLRDAQGGFSSLPSQTYFDIAEAHQWLYLNQGDRALTTLRWFWEHQAATGLYTWWEGNGEENTFPLWQDVRGWVRPPHVTPYYWTAAEMLLLQIDMLAYTDNQAKQPTVVIGGGIPAEWLNKPMSVRGLPMPNGKLDWVWDGQRMNVKIQGEPVNVKLGSVFPANTQLNIEYPKSA